MVHVRDDYNQHIQDDRLPGDGGIPDKEPVFLFRGQDRFAAAVLRYYAGLLNGAARGDADLAVMRSVERHAAKMDEWPVKKYPDVPGVNDGMQEAKPADLPADL